AARNRQRRDGAIIGSNQVAFLGTQRRNRREHYPALAPAGGERPQLLRNIVGSKAVEPWIGACRMTRAIGAVTADACGDRIRRWPKRGDLGWRGGRQGGRDRAIGNERAVFGCRDRRQEADEGDHVPDFVGACLGWPAWHAGVFQAVANDPEDLIV